MEQRSRSAGAAAAAFAGSQRMGQQYPARSFLGTLAPADRNVLTAVAVYRAFALGDHILTEGGGVRPLAALLDGRAKVIRTAESGRDVILDIRRSGDLLGEGSLTAGNAIVDVVALEHCACLLFSWKDFQDLIWQRPTLALAVIGVLAQFVGAGADEKLKNSVSSVNSRLAGVLLDLVDGWSGSGDLTVRGLSQEELASLLGASRDAVYKALASMRRRGLVSTSRRGIRLLDIDGLLALARRPGFDAEAECLATANP